MILHHALLLLGWVTFLVWFYNVVRLVGYLRSKGCLPPADYTNPPASMPRLGVVVAACNEEAGIEAGLRSLLAQDYPNLAIVAVDDRSTDGTGQIMDRLVRESPRLHVIHVEQLPAGWLGKNHANWLGSAHPATADAEYLLFTDGDVVFSPDCLRRAMSYSAANALDHMCLLPRMLPGSFLESAVCHFFVACFLLRCRPWHLANPAKPHAFAGVGAFNMLRREAYAAIGTHQALRLEVVDDYKLGKLAKRAGFRGCLLDGGGAVHVRWYMGLRGVVCGLEKNAFASNDYSVVITVGVLALTILGFIFPYPAAVGAAGSARWGFLATIAVQIVTLAWFGGRSGTSRLVGLAFPVCAAAIAWAILRSMVLTWWRGGVVWRNTFYPLAELKRGRV